MFQPRLQPCQRRTTAGSSPSFQLSVKLSVVVIEGRCTENQHFPDGLQLVRLVVTQRQVQIFDDLHAIGFVRLRITCVNGRVKWTADLNNAGGGQFGQQPSKIRHQLQPLIGRVG